MKYMKRNRYSNWLMSALLMMTGAGFTACNDQPDKYEPTGGSPEVKYIRLPESADSIITQSYMETTICLVGNNLKSITKMLFNDQVAVLNTSYITDNYLLVDIPDEIPTAVTDKIYMINTAGDTTTYDFHVIVPAPTVSAMSNEYAEAGEEVTITGDYFIQDPYIPLEILFNDSTLSVTDITSISKTSVTFTVPTGAVSGPIYVKTVYGTSRSQFHYKDTRNILFDFDGSHGGLTGGNGWRPGVVKTGGIDGSYLYFGGVAMAGKVGATWAEDQFCMNYWPDPDNGKPELSSIQSFAEILDTCEISEMSVKFECRVPSSSPWSSSALQIMFTGNSDVSGTNQNNGYYTNTSLPRGLWYPWLATGTYTTGDTWATITIPLSSFNKTHEGQAAGSTITKDRMTGLTLFVWQGGVEGTDCNPEIFIDNVRVVPTK